MISYKEALEKVLQAQKIDIIHLSPQDACGYVLAAPITSQTQVPPFANSAMDGFAVHVKDISTASQNTPVSLPILGSSFAGDRPGEKVDEHQAGAWEIMTGAAIPQTYDAVVKIEDVSVVENNVTFTAPVPHHNNIRRAGEDISEGDFICEENTLLSPYHVMVLATLGLDKIPVYRKPPISVLSTGKELVDEPNASLKPGQIRNSNGPYLMSAIQELGYEPHYGGTIPDDPDLFESRLKERLPVDDIIISTGAVSAGKHDFIPDSLRKLGAKIIFHKVAMRPGKPILYARFENGQHYFGLPGNPVAAAVGLRFFVTPLLRHMQALKEEEPIRAVLQDTVSKKPSFCFFKKAHLSMKDPSNPKLALLDGQESFKIKPMLQANCWAVLSEDHDGNSENTSVPVYPLNPQNTLLGGAL